MSAPRPARSSLAGIPMSDETLGLWLGFIGVVMFAITLPATRVAVGAESAPQLPPLFVTSARAAIAGLLGLAYLLAIRAPIPERRQLGPMIVCALGTAVFFPLFLALALRHAQASHAAVVSGLVPLATAISAALWFRQRPSTGFWVCAATGFGLVLAFALYRAGGHVTPADILLVLGVISSAIGFVGGTLASERIPATQAISWVLVLCLPLSLPATLMTWPERAVDWQAWAALFYVGAFSMWISFFAWYRGMVLGGPVRVSQVQLVQPILAILFSLPLANERFDIQTMGFALAIVVTVLISRKLPTRQPG